jgi:hypothetical protein
MGGGGEYDARAQASPLKNNEKNVSHISRTLGFTTDTIGIHLQAGIFFFLFK